MNVRSLYLIAIALLLGLPAYATSPKLEVSVVVDWQTVQHYGSVDNVRQVVKDTFSGAAYIYKRDLDIDLVASYVEVPSTADEANLLALPLDTKVDILVQKLVDWRQTRPSHLDADVTVLFTVRDLAMVSDHSYIGYATFCTVCAKNAAAAIELNDNGLDSYTLAHELGHILGAPHDGDPNEACSAEPTSGYIMEARLVGHDTFSPCSVAQIKKWVSYIGDCMVEKPTPAPTSTPTSPTTTVSAAKKGGGSIDLILLSLLLFVLVARRRIQG